MILIDGHNLLFKRCDTFKPNIETEIEHQTSLLLNHLANKKSIIVYDGNGGKNGYGFEKKINKTTKVVYSGKFQKADDWIVAWISKNPSEMVTLVTDDLGLRKRAKAKRVKFENCLSWFDSTNPKTKITKRNKGEFGSVDYWEDYFDGD